MGADPVAGTTRSGVQPGDLTVFGPAVQSQREGIAGLFENTPLGSIMPKRARIPGYDMNVLLPDLMDGPAVGGGTEPPGVPYFTSSTASTRDAASVPESTFRPLFTTDPEERNFIEEDFEVNRRATSGNTVIQNIEQVTRAVRRLPVEAVARAQHITLTMKVHQRRTLFQDVIFLLTGLAHQLRDRTR